MTAPDVRFVEPEKLLSCVHCGLCLSSCPTYVELGTEADSPRGRILLMRAMEEGRLAPSKEVTRHLDTCLGCRACETACPSGVPYGALLEAARPFVEEHRPLVPRVLRRALDAALTRPTLRGALTAPLRILAGRPWTARLARATKSSLLGYAAALPAWRNVPSLPPVLEPEGNERGTAVLLTGCVTHSSFPETTVDIARLLTRAGVRVLVPPDQGCCGALSVHLGDDIRSRDLALALTRRAFREEAQWYVSTAAGCGAHLREYAALLPHDSAAGRITTGARDPLDLLAELGLPPPVGSIEKTVAMHDPCHLLHGQGVQDAPRQLLSRIPGIDLVELAEGEFCCGSAGTYNLTEPELASRLLERKLADIRSSGADAVAAANPGCLLQIRAGAIVRGMRVEVVHPIELLAHAHGLRKERWQGTTPLS